MMKCTKVRGRLSIYLDHELGASVRREIDAHLRGCEACREHLHSLQGVVGMVRGLEPLAAPEVPRLRPVPAARAARWERIRSRRLAPPRPMLRPILYAAAALTMVLALMASMERVGRPVPEGDGTAGPELRGRIPAETADATPQERPDWLKREIARRVLAAQSEESAAEPNDAPAAAAEEPTRIASLPASGDPGDRDDRPAVAEPDAGGATAGASPAAPRNRVTSRAPEPTEPPAAPEEPVRLAEAAPAPGSGAGGGAATSAPTWVGVPVPAPQQPAVASSGEEPARPPQPQGTRLVRAATPATADPGAGAEPAAVEIGAVLHTVALLSPVDQGTDVTFVDAGGSLSLPEGDRSAVLEGAVRTPTPQEVPEPEPDAETGILPAVPKDRPGIDLHGRAAELRDRGLVTPVALHVTISPEGSVTAVSLVSGSGLDWLDEALIDAVRGWSFRPAERYGEPLATGQEIVVEFDLD